MQAPLRKKSEMKILILYLMDRVHYPLDYMTLHDIMTIDALMSSFDFNECFAELLEAGNIAELKDDAGDDKYEVTEQGSRVTEALKDSLIYSIRDKVYKTALSYINFQLSGRRTECTVTTDDKKRPVINCAVSDDSGTLMSISAVLESDEQAKKMKENWDSRPEAIYRSVLSMISGEVDYIL